MEAFKIVFLTSNYEGKNVPIINRTFAPTGWEATQKSKKYLQSIGHQKLVFLKWKVLTPWEAHFGK